MPPKPKSDKPKVTLYHSELKTMGEGGIVTVTVNGNPGVSQYPNRQTGEYPEWIKLMVGGRERQYIAENPGCMDAFRGQAGKTITIHVEGGAQGESDTAVITRVGAPGSQTPPPQRKPLPFGSNPKHEPSDNDGGPPDEAPDDGHTEDLRQQPATRQPDTRKPFAQITDPVERAHRYFDGSAALVEMAMDRVFRIIGNIDKRCQTNAKNPEPLTRDQKMALIPPLLTCILYGASNSNVSASLMPVAEKGGAK